MAPRRPLEAHFKHFWAQGYERNCSVARRVREKLRNGAQKDKENIINYATNSRMHQKNAVNYERNSLRQKGTQEMLANLTKFMNLQGKVTYSATPLARNKKVQKM